MRAYVFTDKSLERFAGQFVWLAIDTEKPQNGWFREKFALEGWPSYYIVDPRTEQVVLRWLGGATVAQLTTLLSDGTKSIQGTGTPFELAMARADKLYAGKKNAEAAAAYREAIALASPDFPTYARLHESLLFALYMSGQHGDCVKVAREVYPRVRDTASAMNVTVLGLQCALELPKTVRGRAGQIGEMESLMTRTLQNRNVDSAADDRSGAYEVLIQARADAGDEKGQRRITEEWAKFLEGEAARAPNAEARAVFDSHRLGAYLELGQPERAVEMLKASERQLPADYNPPARLAVAYRAMKRYDDALAASDRALEKAYGPRKLLILSTRADLYKDKGDLVAAQRTLEGAIRLAESMPAGQRSEGTIATLKKKLAAVSGAV